MSEERRDIHDALQELGSYVLLCHVHRWIWRDKEWPLGVRLNACKELFYLKLDLNHRGHRVALILALLLLLVPTCHAQTISPVVTEAGGKKARGAFTVTNNSVQPLAVIIEAQSLRFENGQPRWEALAATVHLRLSETSARISAKSSHEFSYEVTCDTKPCAVTFQTKILVALRQNGLNVAIKLPSTVYLCEKPKGCRKAVIGAS